MYREEWDRLIAAREFIARMNVHRAVKSMKGIALEKFHAMEHRYPTKVDIIDAYGYDGKQVSHLIRVYDYLERYIAGESYKDCLIPFEQRLSMVDLMISKYNNLLLSDIGNDDNYQYTYQVLDYFKKRYIDDDIYFICGMDNLINLELWVKYQYILNTYKLLVIKRNGENVDNVLKKYQGYIDNIIITELLENELSSTYIRNNIMNEDICKYLDERVYSYIRKNNIYKKVD
jgi:nicotinate (nicotinamide) nucleotide adenylyltransferase